LSGVLTLIVAEHKNFVALVEYDQFAASGGRAAAEIELRCVVNDGGA
jgi:hypothetical protein